jgi:hypothetical protein
MTCPVGSPCFRVYHQDDCLAEIALDFPYSDAVSATLTETNRISFEVEPREPGLAYRIEIGDITPRAAIAQSFRGRAEWPCDAYFESARGLVMIKLSSRPDESESKPWSIRASLLIAVNSSKLTEESFEAMVGDLSALSCGLLFDLISKSSAGIATGREPAAVRISPRSAQLELHFLEALLKHLSLILLEIARQPETVLEPRRVIAAWTGTERLSHDGLGWFAARGIHPREASVTHELLGPRLQTVTETHTVEHGVIRWFLELLRERARDCAKRAGAERRSLEAEKPYRSRSGGNEPSLFDLFDQPKIDRLNEAVVRAERIANTIRGLLTLTFLSKQRPIPPRERTPVFRYVLSYHRFWRAMREYLRHATLLLEHSLDERSKPTWRMYEQWVFLQIAAACEQIGLRPTSQESLFRRLGAHLFTVDLRRGTRLSFMSSDGRSISIRYEPWIFSRDLARRNGDPVFQGREGETPWSPDILIEIYEPTSKGIPPRLDLGIVIDAKYSRRLEEHHWDDTSKYQMIRDTETGGQILRQVWVACPAELDDGSIATFRDPSVRWTHQGPDRPLQASEFQQGAVSLIPDPLSPRGEVCPAASELMQGLLSWLRFQEATGRDAIEASQPAAA